MSGRRTWVTVPVLLLLILVSDAAAKTDEVGRVRVLYLGNIALKNIMLYDPTIQVDPVPAYLFGMGLSKVQRFLRIYMPRTYGDLVDNHDVIYIGDSGVRSYSPKWLEWMSRAVVDGGVGFVMSGGSESFGGRGEDPSWSDSVMDRALPVSCEHVDSDSGYFRFFKLVVLRTDDDLMASLPFEEAPSFHYLNMHVYPKEGAVTLAQANLPEKNPAIVVTQIGRSRSVAFMPYITDPRPQIVPFAGWTYYIDFVPNLMIYTASAPLPEDYVSMHLLRKKIGEYSNLRGLALSVLNFAEEFGANTVRVRGVVAEADDYMERAKALFIKKEVDLCKDELERAIDTLEQAQDLALKAKRRAMFWIYTIEWLAVTATLMLSGIALWELMIRRRIYREVGTTRPAHL